VRALQDLLEETGEQEPSRALRVGNG